MHCETIWNDVLEVRTAGGNENKAALWCILMQFETMFLGVWTAKKILKAKTQTGAF